MYHLDDPDSALETHLEHLTLHFDFNLDDQYMTFDFDPAMGENFNITELNNELPISIRSGIEGFGRTYDDINSLYMKVTDLELKVHYTNDGPLAAVFHRPFIPHFSFACPPLSPSLSPCRYSAWR